MPTDRSFHVRPVLDGQTLAATLRRLVPALSWADAKALVLNRHVHINGNLVLDETRRIKGGDVVKIFEHARPKVPTEKDVVIRHIDPDLLVVEKPAGMTTLRHAEERNWDVRRKQRQPTLDEVLQQMLPGLLNKPAKKVHPAKRDPRHSAPPRGKVPKVRPVHRLDRDTSGVMIFALSPAAEVALVRMFKSHTINRAYLAACHGAVEARRIETWITRDRGDGLRGSTPRRENDPDAQQAITHVKPVEHIGDQYTLVECKLETGRTHQIRVHLSEIGHMLCGEKVYTRATAGAAPQVDESGAVRQALHSTSLTFLHPVTNREMNFQSPLPDDLQEWWNCLRTTARSS